MRVTGTFKSPSKDEHVGFSCNRADLELLHGLAVQAALSMPKMPPQYAEANEVRNRVNSIKRELGKGLQALNQEDNHGRYTKSERI